MQFVFVDYYSFVWFDFVFECCVDYVQGVGFGCKYIGVVDVVYYKWVNVVWVVGCDDLVIDQYDKCKSVFNLFEGVKDVVS